eukprot:9820825-Ditylum_brightwellii.AAC.1
MGWGAVGVLVGSMGGGNIFEMPSHADQIFGAINPNGSRDMDIVNVVMNHSLICCFWDEPILVSLLLGDGGWYGIRSRKLSG